MADTLMNYISMSCMTEQLLVVCLIAYVTAILIAACPCPAITLCQLRVNTVRQHCGVEQRLLRTSNLTKTAETVVSVKDC